MENSSSQKSTFDRVFDLINNIATAEEYKDKVSVLPIMCGTGKSTVISRLIKHSIERNEGLIVLTDRIDSCLSALKLALEVVVEVVPVETAIAYGLVGLFEAVDVVGVETHYGTAIDADIDNHGNLLVIDRNHAHDMLTTHT